MTETVAPPPVAEDYTASTFQGRAISLTDLFRANVTSGGQAMIKGRTFTDCVIEGPAVLLALGGVVFDGCDMGYTAGGDARALLLMPMAKNRVIGAIAMQDCRFERCRFFMVGFTGSDKFIDQFLQVLGAPEGRAQ